MFFVRSMIIAGGFGAPIILMVCFVVFVAAYLPAVLWLRVPTSEEREKVRRGVERVQQLVYVGRSANSVS